VLQTHKESPLPKESQSPKAPLLIKPAAEQSADAFHLLELQAVYDEVRCVQHWGTPMYCRLHWGKQGVGGLLIMQCALSKAGTHGHAQCSASCELCAEQAALAGAMLEALNSAAILTCPATTSNVPCYNLKPPPSHAPPPPHTHTNTHTSPRH
jgi:hypothetical protein